jgi:hypothetical protein
VPLFVSGHHVAQLSELTRRRRGPLTIEDEVAKPTGGHLYLRDRGLRVLPEFSNVNVVDIDGNQITIAFGKAGEKRVVGSLRSGCFRILLRLNR